MHTQDSLLLMDTHPPLQEPPLSLERMCGELWAGLEPASPLEARVELRRRPSWACWKPSFWLGSHSLSVALGVGPRLELDLSYPNLLL